MKTSENNAILPIALMLFFFTAESGFAMTAKEIIAASEQLMQGNTQIAAWEIIIKTKRWTRTMKGNTFMKRKEKKTFSTILYPKKDAGNRFLLLDQLMWHYIPKLGQTIKISPSMMLQSWMGSDFTNDDIVKESSILRDYTHTLAGEETVNGFPCHQLVLLPKPEAAVVWGKMHYYARTTDHLPVRVEYYNEHDIMKKFLIYSDYKHMDDRTIPAKMKMQTVGKEDRYTTMELLNVKFDRPIPDKVFTLQYLKRR